MNVQVVSTKAILLDTLVWSLGLLLANCVLRRNLQQRKRVKKIEGDKVVG